MICSLQTSNIMSWKKEDLAHILVVASSYCISYRRIASEVFEAFIHFFILSPK